MRCSNEHRTEQNNTKKRYKGDIISKKNSVCITQQKEVDPRNNMINHKENPRKPTSNGVMNNSIYMGTCQTLMD